MWFSDMEGSTKIPDSRMTMNTLGRQYMFDVINTRPRKVPGCPVLSLVLAYLLVMREVQKLRADVAGCDTPQYISLPGKATTNIDYAEWGICNRYGTK